MSDSLLARLMGLPYVEPRPPSGVPAAVLLALAPAAGDDLDIVLIARPAWLRHHAGQVAFPGGAVEETDADAAAAALREAEEEVGLPRGAVQVLGTMGSFIAVSSFDVLPVVGLWDGRRELRPNHDEVGAIYRPTLGHLSDPAHHGTRLLHELVSAGDPRRTLPPDAFTPVFDLGPTFVWGFTAGVLAGFLRALGLPAPPVPASWPRRLPPASV